MSKKGYRLKFKAKFLVAIVFVGYFSSILFRQELEMHRQKKRIGELRQEISQVKQDNDSLSRRVKHTRSDEYVEQAARDKLGWVKEGETIFMEKNKN